ncbi:MAG: divergent PAP2 family protein [Clostridium sp.]|nr:divergent PAP2 family protein [Clostridium sp.]
MDIYTQYRYLIVPFVTWFCVQTFKVLWELATTKKFNFKRIIGAGGMPSSHTAIVVSITTMVGRSQGINSVIFAVSLIFSLVVMYDACGVRRQAGKQARILNDIVNTPGLTTVQVREKLVEALGHTPLQVIVGAIVGFTAGMLF